MRSPQRQKDTHSRTNGRFVNELRTAAIEARYSSFEEIICSIPRGKVATYGQIAEAAGYPRGHRLVARFLREMCYNDVPWQRVIGAGGEIKTSGTSAARQRSLLRGEGVTFDVARIDMNRYGHIFD